MVDGIQGPGGTSSINQGSGDMPDLSTSFDDLLAQSDQIGAGDSMYYLKLQQKISQEARVQEALSNVLKAQDDADKAPINNIR